MTKNEKRELALTIINEIKISYVSARSSKSGGTSKIGNVLRRINLVETNDSWEVSIPFEIYYYKYGVKNGGRDFKMTQIERVVYNGVNRYFNNKMIRNKVTIE